METCYSIGDVYLYRWIQTDISTAQELRPDPADRSQAGCLTMQYIIEFGSTTIPPQNLVRFVSIQS